MRAPRPRGIVTAGLTSVVMAAVLVSIVAAEEISPEETIRRYLTALQDQKFDQAYELVSSGMRGGKTKEAWAKEQQYIMQLSEAKIFDFKIYPGKIEGEKAKVPNILSSQDKFLNQLGVEEYEIYTLVKENGAWKVDQQQIAEGADLTRWFPKKPSTAGP